MISESYKQKLKKQSYGIVGSHSAVKTCGWTKNMIKGLGGCYKLKFYGIMSHQCMQMTTSLTCANKCAFCWRDNSAPVSRNWTGAVDDSKTILEESLKKHENLLIGIKGSREAIKNPNPYNQSKSVKHVALSLTGEPIIYPKFNEIVREFHKKNVSTFLVTNGQHPDQIKNLIPVTQLYISVDAPNKKLLKRIDKPLFEDYWERLNKSLGYMAEKKYRTCIRITMIKGINDNDFEGYAKLIEKGNPYFIEVKAYMHVGSSTNRLKFENMPIHEEVVPFAKKLNKLLDDYEIVTEHIPSRVVLLAKKKFKKNNKWFTWIDFNKFFELIKNKKEIKTEDFLLPTPETGISGKGTLDRAKEFRKKGKKVLEVREV